MSSRYPESQDSQSQDLFIAEERRDGTIDCNSCVTNTNLLKEVLQELKELKAKVEGLNGAANKSSGGGVFRVEKSLLEKPLTQYLKSRFARNPFLGDPDIELKQKIIILRRKLIPDVDSSEVIRVAFSYSARKMADFRGQTKAKLLSKGQLNKQEDLGKKDLDDLQSAIFKKFLGNPDHAEDSYNLTISLRSFCHENKLFPKQGGITEGFDFWGEFKTHFQNILDDQDTTKWNKIKEREIKRIERYNK